MAPGFPRDAIENNCPALCPGTACYDSFFLEMKEQSGLEGSSVRGTGARKQRAEQRRLEERRYRRERGRAEAGRRAAAVRGACGRAGRGEARAVARGGGVGRVGARTWGASVGSRAQSWRRGEAGSAAAARDSGGCEVTRTTARNAGEAARSAARGSRKWRWLRRPAVAAHQWLAGGMPATAGW
jgi:hypothetical protein